MIKHIKLVPKYALLQILIFVHLFTFALQAHAEKVSLENYTINSTKGQALICKPKGKGPFPTVIYNHGMIVDLKGYEGARSRNYKMDKICEALANDGFLAFAPIRKSGAKNLPGHQEEIVNAIDYVKSLPEVDPSRIALMGFSRGGFLTLSSAAGRSDLKAVLLLAPAPGRDRSGVTTERVVSINAPVLLLVEASDDQQILQNFDKLAQALREKGKDATIIKYDRGGGHKLFWNTGYYWKDVLNFLCDKLAK